MKKQNSNRSKRIVKTEKGYAGDSVLTQKQVEQGNLYIAQKEIGQQNENLKIPSKSWGIFYTAIYSIFMVLVHVSLYCTYCFFVLTL